MRRRELLKALPALAVAAQATEVLAQHAQPTFEGRLRPGVVALSFRPQLESGKMTYEDAVRYIADLGLEGMDLTSYWFPPLLDFKPGIPSQQISEMVRQTPANPTSRWLASLRNTAYKNGVQILYPLGTEQHWLAGEDGAANARTAAERGRIRAEVDRYRGPSRCGARTCLRRRHRKRRH